jgi:hypothetical protein
MELRRKIRDLLFEFVKWLSEKHLMAALGIKELAEMKLSKIFRKNYA